MLLTLHTQVLYHSKKTIFFALQALTELLKQADVHTLLRLPTGADSTWAFIRIAEAHLMLDEVKPACTALRSARTTARTMNQAEVINRYSGTLGCAQ